MPPHEPLVRLAGVEHSYPSRRGARTRALRGVDLSLDPGTVTLLAGANGSGKSTLLRIAAGLLRPDAGHVTLCGVDSPATAPERVRRAVRGRVVHLDQAVALDPDLHGDELLRLLAALDGVPRRERGTRIETLTERFAVAPLLRRPIARASGGQKRRLHLVGALLAERELLLLDEPAAGLDAAGRDALWRELRARADAGAAVLVADHAEDAARHVDRVVTLVGGAVDSDLLVDRPAESDETLRVDLADGAPERLARSPDPGAGVVPFDVALAVARRTWIKTVRRPVQLTFSLVQPLVWMTFFGFLFHRFDLGALTNARGDAISYLDFLAPGVCAMTILFGGSQAGIAWIRDLQTRLLPRLLATPAPPSALLAGHLAADVARLVAQAVAVLLLAIALGARPVFAPGPFVAGVGFLLLFAFGFSSLSCALALRSRTPETMATFVHLVNMPLLFTSTALVPARQMPDWLAELAVWNPLSLAVDAWRGALLDAAMPPFEDALVLLALTALPWLAARYEMQRLAAGASP